MSDIIRLLPDALANQIAAGEVVQRPASVVKELLENAIDAGATSIRVIIKDAGKLLVQVIDNGSGMSITDARMSLERHATSKISSSDDLFKIRTMGFRGEALASIAAVAQVELKTKTENEELGTEIFVEGSVVKTQEPTACEAGTSIAVKNLFYNVPARRNFLKSNGVEMKHIVDEFQRVALANPEVAMSLYQNDLETFKLTSGKLSHRIVGLFGKNYREQMASCEEETASLRVYGYIGKPDFSKKTRGEQFFYVNNRFIKSNYFNHAVMNAFEGLLPEDTYPFYVLFIEIDPAAVDVNVHPTKTEVKFEDERMLYAVIRSAVRQALGKHNITPSLDFDADINISQKLQQHRETVADKNYSQFRSTQKEPREQANLEHWEKLYDENEGRISKMPQADREVLTFGSEMHQSEIRDVPQDKVIYQLHQRYILSQVKSGLMVIHQQAAHERILYERFLQHLDNKSGASQQSLFPQTINLEQGDYDLVMEIEHEVRALGFIVEPFGKHDLLIKGVPADVKGSDEKDIFEGLIEQFKKNKSELSISKRENLARSLARRSSLKAGKTLNTDEMGGLIDQLFACSNPNYSPNGQRTYYILELSQLENYFD